MKHVLLIVTGSIAAPKALELYDMLTKKYQVTVIMTPSATKFAKFKNNIPVYQNFLDQSFYEKTSHIEHTNFATSHELIIVYPATMNFISKAALAIPDNLALATFLASSQPKLIFPAMNNNMYLNHSFQNNLAILQKDDSVKIIEPDVGMLACNVIGIGRLKPVAVAYEIVETSFEKQSGLQNKTVLINYGATRTYIDDMRYISNNSSGKMGEALINACLWQAARVIAVAGDSVVQVIKDKNLLTIDAGSNEDMLQAMTKYYQSADIVFSVAALNDYLVYPKITGKINKSKNPCLTLNLVPNIDVLEILGKNKKQQILIGFSAQDSKDVIIGKDKMKKKNCDGIVINSIKTMGQNQSEVTFYFNNMSYHWSGTKKQIAQNIVNVIVQALNRE